MSGVLNGHAKCTSNIICVTKNFFELKAFKLGTKYNSLHSPTVKRDKNNKLYYRKRFPTILNGKIFHEVKIERSEAKIHNNAS